MDADRKGWNARQKKLRTLLSDPASFAQAIDLFLQQHAEVHSSAVSSHGSLSFEDMIIRDLTAQQMVEIPDRMEHSIAWIMWHLARIEDVTMNMLIAGESQLLERDDWKRKMGIPAVHTGNAMSKRETIELSRSVDISELKNYRVAVGRRTEEIVKQLDPDALVQAVSPTRLDLLLRQGAVVEEAKGLIDYWGKRTIAGLLLMPPTRHCFIHLNEAARIKAKLV